MAQLNLLDGLGDYLEIESVGLTLDKFYYTLNHDEKNLKDYYSECELLLSGKQHFKNKRLCQKLLRYLKSSNTISDKNDSAYDECLLLNYWIYGKLAQLYGYKYTKVNPAFGELNFIWNDLIENESKLHYFNKCKPDFDIPKQDDWDKRKELYDYCVNYETLSGTANNFKDSCKNIYRYIKGKAHLYKHFNERCASGNEKLCPKFYSKCEKYNPDKVLHQLKCHEDMKKEETSPPAHAGALSENAHSDLSPSPTFSPEASQLKGDGTHPVTQTGNILLGVVATSLTSGALYREELYAMDLDGTIII
ncbi:unnamed protein product [Plasmodium vivax]|uniref:(malaria parasite P. vivax) hypothetical protein n=1 Tax=Plasmodium vivax TaxID=5855 RepID=A0A8S4HCZ4_PLAVI|nr:unnamed protein product [Plasmodium vivax]